MRNVLGRAVVAGLMAARVLAALSLYLAGSCRWRPRRSFARPNARKEVAFQAYAIHLAQQRGDGMKEWTVHRVFQRARQVLREEGLRSLWFKLLGETIYRRVELFACELDSPPPVASTSLPIELGTLPAHALDEYLALRPDADANDIRRRLAAGQRCFTARHQGRLVHTCWVATGRATIDYLSREIQLTPADVYPYQSFTLPDFRGRNVAAVRHVYQRQVMRHAGYRRMISVVMPENTPGIRAAEKAGYRRIGTLRTVWLGRRRRDVGRIPPAASSPRSPA